MPTSATASRLPDERQQSEATETLLAQCHCKSVHFRVTVPHSALPLPAHLCHCHICRQTHGALASFHAPLPDDIAPEFISPSSIADSLTAYTHSPEAASTRYFCKTCGCHIGDVDVVANKQTGNRQWRVATSIFAEHGQDVFQFRTQMFTRGAPTQGGAGLPVWLRCVGDRELDVLNPEPGDAQHPIPLPGPPQAESDEHGEQVIRAQCHCGGVSFAIPRPDHPVHQLCSDPFISCFIAPNDPRKWIGVLDTCSDCRLVTGAHVQAWTFVPAAFCSPPVPSDLKGFGTLVPYKSSTGVLRGFCGVCGATVFFSCEGRAPSQKQRIVDVAVGLLRAPEGDVVCDEWVTWRTGRIAHRESGRRFDAAFSETLEQGFAEWGIGRYGEAYTWDVRDC